MVRVWHWWKHGQWETLAMNTLWQPTDGGYGTGGQVAAEDTVVAEEEVKEEEANCSEWADESCNFSAS